MKKTILALGLMVALASCGGGAKEETPATDSTAVTVDTTAKCVTDSCAAACADSAKAVK